MRNNKGFTLIELLVMLVVLGILMVVAIPNITGIMKNNRLNALKGDAQHMVERTNVMVTKSKNISKPAAGECIIFSLNYLNTNDDLTAGPNDGLYNQEESFVIYTRQGQKYAYYVRLIEEVDGRNIGFDLINSENIEYITAEEVKEINDLVGISIVESSADNIEMAKGNAKIHNICGDNIKAVYMEK